MSLYISPSNEYPRFIGDIQLEYPTFTFGDKLPNGWKLVIESVPPIINEDETWEEIEPTQNESGDFVQTFLVRKLTTDELEKRNAPKTAKAKLLALGLTEIEISALTRGLIN